MGLKLPTARALSLTHERELDKSHHSSEAREGIGKPVHWQRATAVRVQPDDAGFRFSSDGAARKSSLHVR